MEDPKPVEVYTTLTEFRNLVGIVDIDKAFTTHRFYCEDLTNDFPGWYMSFKTKKGVRSVYLWAIPGGKDMLPAPTELTKPVHEVRPRNLTRGEIVKIGDVNVRYLFRMVWTFLEGRGFLQTQAWAPLITLPETVDSGAPPKDLKLSEGSTRDNLRESLEAMTKAAKAVKQPFKLELVAFLEALNGKPLGSEQTFVSLANEKGIIAISICILQCFNMWQMNNFKMLQDLFVTAGMTPWSSKPTATAAERQHAMLSSMTGKFDFWKDAFANTKQATEYDIDLVLELSTFSSAVSDMQASGVRSILERSNALKKKRAAEASGKKESLKDQNARLLAELEEVKKTSSSKQPAEINLYLAEKDKEIAELKKQAESASGEEAKELSSRRQAAEAQKEKAQADLLVAMRENREKTRRIKELEDAALRATEDRKLKDEVTALRDEVAKVIMGSNISQSPIASNLGIEDIRLITDECTSNTLDFVESSYRATKIPMNPKKILDHYEKKWIEKAKIEMGLTARSKKGLLKRSFNTFLAVLYSPLSMVAGLVGGVASAWELDLEEGDRDRTFLGKVLAMGTNVPIFVIGTPVLSVVGAFKGNDFELGGFIKVPKLKKPGDPDTPPLKPWWKFW
ncbi:hypothetical protein MiFV1_gp3 [Morchella importuna fusarivirus 1]|uniref:Uncharacterized protein n=1 Tax=Morchella importuna fusarivirus 1 TaxID=2501218 RepID=A0A3T0D0S0_9VIRU|nr:hypothetical protein MiFV1_gp3 [Morchella importuna fusarivirus 1]